MWNDFVTWFDEKVAVLNGWVDDGTKLFYYALPVAAFVWFVLTRFTKKSRKEKEQLKDQSE